MVKFDPVGRRLFSHSSNVRRGAAMEEQLAKTQFNWRMFKRWRQIQIASLLPLILTGVFMLYFREAPQLGITAFFLILIVGVLLPQIRGDLTLSHIIITKELEERLKKLEESMVKLLEERLGDAETRKSMEAPPFLRR